MVAFKYYISLNSNEFSLIKKDKFFPVVLSFARSINALEFVKNSFAEYRGDSVHDDNYIINSFFFSLSVLYEGFKIIDRNYLLLSKLDSFQKGFANLLSDKKFKKFKQEIMGKVRNNFCFHFLNEITMDIFNYFEFDDYNFAEADGEQVNNIYYGLADTVAINMLVKNNKDKGKNGDDYLGEIIKFTMYIAEEYIHDSELIIEEFIDRTGWKIKKS